ncbi:penicillin-binding transpeptidase domain-containing protein [Streptomyces sp. SAS_270]|uniref:penicillin-binding transpeptidase domain-containing protein n=1 Tax=Streptomyces sp. SAS_270 TaxID=3412748 RepID=UPI00403C7B3C
MHSTIRGALSVSGVLAALAALSTGCGKDGSHTDSADKPRTKPTSQPSSHPGLGNILVGGKAVTGSKATGNKKMPYQRTYTDGALYAPVTGYRSMTYGITGLEAVYDDVLAAKASGAASGNVVTTIDPAAQKAAFDALGDRQGAAVALDAESGKLLLAVSTPSYDPAAFSGQRPADAKAWKAANADKRSPMVNRALHRVGSPGGTFSVVVAAAALENGLYETVDDKTSSPLTYVLPRTVTRVTGISPRCENASIRQALRYSCANVFAKMAADLGAAKLRSTAEKFGFNDDTLTVPVKVSESTYPQGDVPPSESALTGMGGGTVTATPLEMARVAAVVANGGRLVAPQLVKKVAKADGSQEKPQSSGGKVEQVITRRTADALRSALKTAASDVVSQSADGMESGISAKTGWVTDGLGGSATAWFTAYADGANGQPIAVAVCIEGLPPSAGGGKGPQQAVAVGEAIFASAS